MRVGLQDPLHGEAVGLHKLDQAFGGVRAGAAGLGVVVQHRIHQGAMAAGLVIDDIAHRPGGVVKEGLYLGFHRFFPQFSISMKIVY